MEIMETNSDRDVIKDFFNRQKIKFHSQARVEKTNILFTSKRNYFINKREDFPFLTQNFDLQNTINKFHEALKGQIQEDVLFYLRPLNNYLYDCSLEELSDIYNKIIIDNQVFQFLKDLLKDPDENFSLLNEFSMLFVNFSALLEERKTIEDFFQEVHEEFYEIFKESNFLPLKNNSLILFGNISLNHGALGEKILNLGITDVILEILNNHKMDLKEAFLKTILWFLEICFDFTMKPLKFFRSVSLIINEINQLSFKKNLDLLKFYEKLVGICPQNDLYEIFSNTHPLISEWLFAFTFGLEIPDKMKECEVFISILMVFSSEIEIIPELLNMNIDKFLQNSLSSNYSLQLKSLDILLNFFCHGCSTIKILLQNIKPIIFGLIFSTICEEISRKALECICICIICGDDEICLGLLNYDLIQHILTHLEDLDVEHIVLLLKTIEKILFFSEEISQMSDEQNRFFDILLELGCEKKLEILTLHQSKLISLLSLHILEKYF